MKITALLLFVVLMLFQITACNDNKKEDDKMAIDWNLSGNHLTKARS